MAISSEKWRKIKTREKKEKRREEKEMKREQKDNEDKKIEPESKRKEPGFRCSFLSLLSPSYSLLHSFSTFLSTSSSSSYQNFQVMRVQERGPERGTERERENQRNMKSNVNSGNFWMKVTHFLAPH